MNLLNIALSVLPKQKIKWCAFNAMGFDDRGRPSPSYDDPVTIWASVQPLDARDYEQYGLDVNKRYYSIWASQDMNSSVRDGAPDKFTTEGLDLEAVANDDWYIVNGWRRLLCVVI